MAAAMRVKIAKIWRVLNISKIKTWFRREASIFAESNKVLLDNVSDLADLKRDKELGLTFGANERVEDW